MTIDAVSREVPRSRRRMVVTGLQGQIARSLINRGQVNDFFDVVATGRPEFDLRDRDSIARALEDAAPDVVVSAAAYTAVDQAEVEESIAVDVNGLAAGEIARIADKLGIPVIHISTDYVFDGRKLAPYLETDAVAPLGAYGRSKLLGERLVADSTDNFAILRTAWVYSPFGRNFLKTMLRLAATHENLNVVSDQVGNPTSAWDIADAVLIVARNLLESGNTNLRGTFHMSGQGDASWAAFAKEIFTCSEALGGPTATVNEIATSAYPTPAKRPANSRLDCSRLLALHGVELPKWKSSTAEVVAQVTNTH